MENSGGPLSAAPASVIFAGLCCSIYLNGAGLPLYLSLFVPLLLVAAWICGGTPFICGGWRPAFAAVLFLTFLFSAVLLLRMNCSRSLPATLTADGKVVLSREWGRARALLIDTDYGAFTAYRFGVETPPEGSRVFLRGALFGFRTASAAKGGFDERLFWRGKGAVKRIELFELKETEAPSGIYRWRHLLTERIKNSLPQNCAAYMLALTVGVRDKELTALHRSAGTVHLLAVSGFHVGIIVSFFSLFFRRGKLKLLPLSLLMWFYIVLAGLPPGGIRAALMVQIYLLGLWAGKPSSSFNSVSTAGIILLLFNPWTFYDVGWRLSMLAALFITAFAKVCKPSLSSALYGSLMVWFVTAPLLAAVFGEVPLAGLLMNAVAIPLFALLFPLLVLFSLPALLGLPWGYQIAALMEYFLEAWNIFSALVTSWVPWSVSYTTPLLLASLVVCGVAFAAASAVSAKRVPFAAAGYVFCSLFLLEMM